MAGSTDVLYNDSCPICDREICHYQRLSAQDHLPLRYDPLSDAETLAQWGLTPDEAARRLHVRKAGEVHSGIPAFILIWQEIPRYRALARFVSLPGVHWVACTLYDHVLAPLLFRAHLRRQRRQRG